MATSLANCRIELSKQLGDYWSSTTTSSGHAGGTTIVDTALKAKANDWIDNEAEMFTLITHSGDSSEDDERKISALDNSTGTLTTLAHTAQVGSAKTYEVHRLFTASEKRMALVRAAKDAFPSIHRKVWDETTVIGNWLRNGSFEKYSGGVPDNWTVSVVTAGKHTTSPQYKHGAASLQLISGVGYVKQGNDSNNPNLEQLAGHSVTFSVQGWCNKASCLRLSVYDGTTLTYGDFHTGDSAWTTDENPLTVTATIATAPTEVTFKIHHDIAAGTSYVDDTRVIGPTRNKIYAGDLLLAQHKPVKVDVEWSSYAEREPWIPVPNCTMDKDYWLHIPSGLSNLRLRIRGMGYLDFYDSSGDTGTDWADTIEIDDPQLQILVAEAACYLYRLRVMPNYSTGVVAEFANALAYWEDELRQRKIDFGMAVMHPRISMGVR